MERQAEKRSAIEIVSDFMSSAPVDLDAMARALGLDVTLDAEIPPDVSGKIERVAGGRFRVSINQKHHANRRRFTLAHEIAHYVLHRDLIGTGVTDNAMYRSANLSDEQEVQANRFAAGLLMPADVVRRKWSEGIRSDAEMAKEFRVSPAAARIRIDELRLGKVGFAALKSA
ncbi:ImmA/IrrE family metallo-endopeptidase [Paramagnetospirillum magneticum]|uniref:Predicted Zn peptidase n=1 Tax=Paramagnetospirillum magneticum (strain ATCC 700264 / AMB-1) TaxID=342108 RepID=Q2W0R8_PARM1|nr:ImmA/IrrE family metallo-endopeptidase [Paramagnetospirillum magneticum]BAE52557.1 Predicted Zn peptidase [Paramagnetospirillum magneticum AMB-1]